MHKLTGLKRIGSLLLALAMVITISVTALPSYAASGGTISVKYNPDVDGLVSTHFRLYKVGRYTRDASGKTVIVLEDDFSSCEGVDLNIDIAPDEEGWQEAWLAQARKLGNYAKNHQSELTTAWEGTLERSGAFQDLTENGQVKTFDNGIYLLVGDEQLIGEKFWTPVPVLIQVLNGNSKFTIDDPELKMTSRTLVHKHTVTKSWQDEGCSDGRPGSVKITLYYGSTKMDTVELSNEKGWVYTWYTYEDGGQWVYTSKNPKDPNAKGVETEKLNEGNSFTVRYNGGGATWGVEEITPSIYGPGENMYVSSISDAEQAGVDSETFSITNTVLLPVSHDPPVVKEVKGDKPKKNETFEFIIEAISTTAKVEEMPMPEGSDGDTKTIKAKAGEKKEFGDIVFRIPGVYIYEIREVDTGKKGYKYDPTVYRLEYTISLPGPDDGNTVIMDLKVFRNGEEVDYAKYTFVNEYTAPPPAPPVPTPFTGDNARILLPAVLFLGALTALIVLLIKRKKNGKDDDR